MTWNRAVGTDPRDTWAWRKPGGLRDTVVREEPRCWLQLPGCTGRSQTADHLITVKQRPDLGLIRANLRGACHSCNHRRNDKTLEQLAAMKETARALSFFD